MLRRTPRLPPLPAGLPGLVLAMWALASQVAIGSVVLPSGLRAQQRDLARLDTLSVLCSSTPVPGGRHAPVPRHAPDCALCPLQAAFATGNLVLADAPTLPKPKAGRIGRAVSLASARGPPAAQRSTALPRGPPAFA